MAKATLLKDLEQKVIEHRLAAIGSMYVVYQNMSLERFNEVMNARNRKLMRKARRSMGNSNKLGYRATANRRVAAMCEMNALAEICRRNRRLGGLNDQ